MRDQTTIVRLLLGLLLDNHSVGQVFNTATGELAVRLDGELVEVVALFANRAGELDAVIVHAVTVGVVVVAY